MANLIVGDGVVVVKAAPGKLVYLGIGSARTVLLTVDAAAVDEFVAESEAVVRRGSRALLAHMPDRPVLEERSGGGRALSFSRRVEGRGRSARVSYHFFASDDRLSGFPLPATAVETKSILQALHRAARVASGAAGQDSARAHVRRSRG